MQLIEGEDGCRRCWWGAEPEIYRHYHDREWGFAVTDDNRLFEKLVLEGFQAGLSWLTILRKREAFRTAFAGFDIPAVAAFDDSDTERLVADAGIVRHRGKIRSAINNARRANEMIDAHGSLAEYFWAYADETSVVAEEIPASTPTSTTLARNLKKEGWTFVGPTTVYAFMQAMGLVNDHLRECWRWSEAEGLRQETIASYR